MAMSAPTDRRRALVQVAAMVIGLVAAIGLLTWMGRGPLGVPSVLEPEAWRRWAAGKDAAVLVFAALRLITLVLAWYLLGATLVGAAARLLHSTRLMTVADVVTVPAVRRLLQSALGVGLATAALTAGSGSAPPPAPAVSVAAATLPDSDPVEMRPLTTERIRMRPAATPAPPPVVQAEPTPERQWTVEPGQHFWSIAEQVLADEWQRQPSEEETTVYWERLVRANRDRLIDPGNPDLIVPGQQFRLPPTPRP